MQLQQGGSLNQLFSMSSASPFLTLCKVWRGLIFSLMVPALLMSEVPISARMTAVANKVCVKFIWRSCAWFPIYVCHCCVVPIVITYAASVFRSPSIATLSFTTLSFTTHGAKKLHPVRKNIRISIASNFQGIRKQTCSFTNTSIGRYSQSVFSPNLVSDFYLSLTIIINR